MREIKFRAWHKGYPDVKIKPQMLYDEKPGDCLNYLKQGQPVELMQYTGLKDKAGKEIYECDFVKDGAPWIWTVRFGEISCDGVTFVGWYLEHPMRTDFSGPFSSFDLNVIEVIGNIHANPELIQS